MRDWILKAQYNYSEFTDYNGTIWASHGLTLYLTHNLYHTLKVLIEMKHLTKILQMIN